MAAADKFERGTTAETRRRLTHPGAVSDPFSKMLLVAIALSSLYGAFGSSPPAQAAQSPPIAYSREGVMAAACRSVRWCSKPTPPPAFEFWMVQGNSNDAV